ncbi:amidohydrolase family protein [Variovorax sp. J22G21]|uniref:amidohydrolase family protein n=1 Tax=Variovorax fucosicus TaxID=3053517 RepID=UPI00257839F7|nr:MULTISPECIES: amidohydrolase family protein [unclassified Variovorax]MDM0041357.1 amidohydrolase family protein [Variovorax sp. J22R193]MDM0060414.1 amidohydrolase family protein [Variovorax sp. J22G21]
MIRRIDSHQHFWRPARGDYAWLRADVPALAPLVRDFLPEHLAPTLQNHGVGRTVLVQAAESEAETDFMLELASAHDVIAGVVGWVDLGTRDAVASLERMARHPKFKGVRPMLQDLPDDDWIARMPHPDAVQALVRLGLRFDALVKPRHLAPLMRFLKDWPQLPVVIDHAAKPPVGAHDSEAFAAWRREMAELAALPQVCCKFSGLWGEAPPSTHRDVEAAVRAVRPVWDQLLESFGPARLMWGSDWPVLTLAGDYADWIAVSEAFIGSLSAGERTQVWRGTAQRFYGLSTD